MKNILKSTLISAALIISNGAFAAGPPKASELSNPLAIALLVVIVGLLVVIGFLGTVVITAAQVYLQRYKEEKSKNTSGGIVAKSATVLLFCIITSATVFAQDATQAVNATTDNTVAGLSATSFYALMSVIVLELIVLVVLLVNLKTLLRKESAVITETEGSALPSESSFTKWWDNINRFRPIQEEADIDLGHDYDGIRELDNKLPPWWLYGFYVTILVACIYLWRYHVVHSAPLSAEEYTISVVKADKEQEEYLKKSANNIDESNVKLLTDAADLDAAKKIFTNPTLCAQCHRADAGGNIGPNLTDDYWLHGGTIQDVFKSIKYGWQDKGMRSWKDEFSPKQIEQLASYVKSLHGSNPANPKPPQGVLFKETK